MIKMFSSSSKKTEPVSIADFPENLESVARGPRPKPWDRETPFDIAFEEMGLDYELLERKVIESPENDDRSWREREVYSVDNPDGKGSVKVAVEYIVGAEYEEEIHYLEDMGDVQGLPGTLDLDTWGLGPDDLPAEVVYSETDVPKSTSINYEGVAVIPENTGP